MSVSPRTVRILNKLESYGADTEKKITALTYPEIMKICKDSKTLAFSDMETIVKLQEEIKARRVIPFLLGNSEREDEEEKAKDAKEVKDDAEKHKKDEEDMSGRQLHAGTGESERTPGFH